MDEDLSENGLLTLPDGSELDLNDLTEDELLELYQSYESGLMSQDAATVGTLLGGNFVSTMQSCVGPTTFQSMEMAAKLFSLCLILRVVSLIKLPTRVKHLVSCLCGVGAFVIFLGEHSMLPNLLFLCVLGYGPLFVTGKYRGVVVSLFCVSYLLTCNASLIFGPKTGILDACIVQENYINTMCKGLWLNVQVAIFFGTFMVLSMKMISLAFDMDQGTIKPIPNIIEYCGYVLCPSSIIFGPFMMYKDYCQILKNHAMSFSWFVSLTKTVIFGYVFLIMSTCITPWIFPEDSNKWLVAYQTALSFRCSNYFVGFLSETSCLLCGIGTLVKEDKDENVEWKVPVSRPQHVELPRSFVEIAIHWSVPNHVFLKNYVFRRAKPLGPFLAILLTFAASSILHGLSFQLAAVLISIGTYAYVEHAFRKKLARRLSMCVESRKCKPDCEHTHKESHYWATVLNLGFGFLNMFHLAYLGAMFDGNSSADRGFGVEYTLEKWSELNYLSHWVVLAMFLTSVVL